jgi:suppressor for copper-sensitivity B
MPVGCKFVGRLAATVAAVGLAAFGGAAAARASSSPWFQTEQGGVRLVAATDAVGDGRTLSLGLEFRMKPGWKIYWRSPGDAGFPPQLDWQGSRNLGRAEVRWPAPERFTVLGLETLGYQDRVVLPVAAESEMPGKPVDLKVRVRYLTCENLCIPYDTTLALALPAGPAGPSPEAAEIARFAAEVPGPDGSAGLDVTGASLTAPASTDDRRVLRVAVRSATPFGKPDLFVEGPPGYSYSAPSASFAPDRRRAVMRISVAPPPKDAAPIVGKALTFTLVDGARGIEARLAPVPQAVPVETPERVMAGGFLAALALALLGGLILNLMPCVLPVLSIKLLSVVGHAGGEGRRVRRGFAASAAGIVVSFLVLGSIAVGLHAAGMAAQWGVQFQQPVFLAAMVLIVTLFAGNLWGLFEIRLPRFVADRAATAGHSPGLAGHFFTGALATLLATPCTAPFLGTAIGFALSRGPVQIYAIFFALGLGLALPYLLVAAFPGLATRLPHPGRWMIVLKRALGVALAGTAAWLAVVLGALAGTGVALAVAALGVSALAAVWLVRRRDEGAHRLGWGAAGALGAAAIALTVWAGGAGPGRADVAGDGPWRKFDLAAIADEVRLGRVVVVDVTADWCLTCKVNKQVVLDAEPVKSLIAANDVTAMLADWTRPNAGIARYLATFGRYGIPFTAVYGPGLPNGVALPELLTPSAVSDAIAKARGGATAAEGRDKTGSAS